mgnify:CR=1 FL=1
MFEQFANPLQGRHKRTGTEPLRFVFVHNAHKIAHYNLFCLRYVGSYLDESKVNTECKRYYSIRNEKNQRIKLKMTVVSEPCCEITNQNFVNAAVVAFCCM